MTSSRSHTKSTQTTIAEDQNSKRSQQSQKQAGYPQRQLQHKGEESDNRNPSNRSFLIFKVEEANLCSKLITLSKKTTTIRLTSYAQEKTHRNLR